MIKEIETIEEFIKESLELREEAECYNKGWESTHHQALAFRGQSSKAYELLPAIGRGRKFSCDISILNQERNLIEMAKYKLPHIFRSDLLPIDLLSLLQHYGIPTNLHLERPVRSHYFLEQLLINLILMSKGDN